MLKTLGHKSELHILLAALLFTIKERWPIFLCYWFSNINCFPQGLGGGALSTSSYRFHNPWVKGDTYMWRGDVCLRSYSKWYALSVVLTHTAVWHGRQNSLRRSRVHPQTEAFFNIKWVYQSKPWLFCFTEILSLFWFVLLLILWCFY